MNTRYYFINYAFSKAKTRGIGNTTMKVENNRVDTNQVCKAIENEHNYHNVVINNFIQITKEQFENGIF